MKFTKIYCAKNNCSFLKNVDAKKYLGTVEKVQKLKIFCNKKNVLIWLCLALIKIEKIKWIYIICNLKDFCSVINKCLINYDIYKKIIFDTYKLGYL